MEIETDVVSNTDGSAKVSLVAIIIHTCSKSSHPHILLVQLSGRSRAYLISAAFSIVGVSTYRLMVYYLFRLCLCQGHTAVLVGIKAEIGKPRPMVPNEGYLEFFVDW